MIAREHAPGAAIASFSGCCGCSTDRVGNRGNGGDGVIAEGVATMPKEVTGRGEVTHLVTRAASSLEDG